MTRAHTNSCTRTGTNAFAKLEKRVYGDRMNAPISGHYSLSPIPEPNLCCFSSNGEIET